MSQQSLTATLLIQQYPALISQNQLAKIFGQHVQTIRRLARAGLLPFQNVSISGLEKKYKLEDVIRYLENPPITTVKRRGRPVGSKNSITKQPLLRKRSGLMNMVHGSDPTQ
ncbi:helix-turn-helix domain-containing protein [Desulfovibrio litoralis]|uniref:Helix-turn-helix domain-containing protein n=1 Tax=Desulfovibrio litoralis DSM 11393 TaxID=1121455 RepID=A0A1M7TNT6_9BACT|nr:helix-turn-helix domain-containing protein [Desulfovibrio litoralis]SHN72336.1 hypothetical protein SAMN02745728_02302 [Desulfovibrio litoralis DSM 11393]